LQQWEVDMDVEPLRLEGSEAPGDGLSWTPKTRQLAKVEPCP